MASVLGLTFSPLTSNPDQWSKDRDWPRLSHMSTHSVDRRGAGSEVGQSHGNDY